MHLQAPGPNFSVFDSTTLLSVKFYLFIEKLLYKNILVSFWHYSINECLACEQIPAKYFTKAKWNHHIKVSLHFLLLE